VTTFAQSFVIESAAIERQRIPVEKVDACAHMEAYRSMLTLADAGAELGQSDLKNWQAMIGREQHLWGDSALPKELLGQYRERDIYIGDVGITWESIPNQMIDLWDLMFERTRGWTGNPNWVNRAPIEKAAIIHHAFERIHPFGDGNGRSGRILALWVLRVNNVPPVLFTNADKGKAYYPCFPDKSPDRMIAYFKTHQVGSWA
jgi:Fic family protein